jgi:glutamine amidotransferase
VIAIIDYGMGNLGSIANMFKRIGAVVTITSDSAVIARADKLVLPGVGAFDAGMQNIRARNLLDVLNQKVITAKTPILGLCLGMQLFTRRSEEGVLPGLGWVSADTLRFRMSRHHAHLKVPHMGWNSLTVKQSHLVFRNLEEQARFYFVHSFYVRCDSAENVLATTVYGDEFASAIVKENIIGTQFHPEKSHTFGMELLRNFAERC